jgi:hypothetical protein
MLREEAVVGASRYEPAKFLVADVRACISDRQRLLSGNCRKNERTPVPKHHSVKVYWSVEVISQFHVPGDLP